MSKAPKNIEKIVLAAGAVIGLGLGVSGFMLLGQTEEDFGRSSPSPRDSDAGVPGAERVPGTINSLQSDRTLAAATVASSRLESGRREIDLFVGVPLFAKRDLPDDPVDLLQSEDIHPPIPNQWWLEHGISPNYADSPRRDEDGDGFSNLEEFEAGTRPNDPASHPEPALKLRYVGHEARGWFLEFGFEAGGKWIPKILDLDNGQKNRVDFAEGLEPGDTFFSDEPFKERFKFLSIEEREVFNERINVNETLRYAIFEDLRPNKLGTKYEIPNRLPRAIAPQFHQFDRTAVLELGALGREGQEFKVEENTRFALPPDAEEKNYLLKRVTPEEIEVEWEVGDETKSRIIPKR